MLYSWEWLRELMYSPVSIFHGFGNICRMWKEQKQTRCFQKVAPLSLLNIIIAISHPHFIVPLLYLYAANFSCRKPNQWLSVPSKQICNLEEKKNDIYLPLNPNFLDQILQGEK